MMKTCLILAMLAAASGIWLIGRRENAGTRGKAAVALLTLLLLGCGVKYAALLLTGEAGELRDSESIYYASQAHAAGKFIREKLHGAAIVLIADPDYRQDFRSDAFLKAFRESAGHDNIQFVPLQTAKRAESLHDSMSADDFNRLVAQHPEADVFVSLVGLPQDAMQMSLLRNGDPGRKPALLLIGEGATERLAVAALRSGRIAAVITLKPEKIDTARIAPRDLDEAFAVRYRLLTP